MEKKRRQHAGQKREGRQKPEREGRRLEFTQESWTEIDAEGTHSEMAQGRTAQEPFYTPLVSEAAERRLKKEKEQRDVQQRSRKKG